MAAADDIESEKYVFVLTRMNFFSSLNPMKRILFIVMLTASLSIAEEKVTITTTDGKTYEGKVTRVEASGIVLMHSGGVARIDFAKLPVDVQVQYGYDQKKAAQQREATAAAQSARQSALMAQRDAAAQKKADTKLMESAEKQTFKVFSVVTGEGILANEYRRGGVAGSLARAMNSISGGGSNFVPPSTGDLVFLTGEIETVVDDDVLVAMVIPDGTFQYETTLGSMATVRKFRVLESKVDE